jgi:alpha-1,2-mannosyltransferase
MKDVEIVHDSLNYCGGAEGLSLETMRSLGNLGFSVSLSTIEKTDWERVRRIFGFAPKLRDEKFLVNRLPFPRTYRSLLSVFSKKRDSNLKVINTNGDAVPRIFDDLTYVHIPPPFNLVVRDGELDNTGLSWDLFFGPSRIVRRVLERFESGSAVLTNSEFSKKKIRRYWGCDATVVYPPVDVETYTALLDEGRTRQDSVVTISRFDSVKNLGVIPWVASQCKAARKFVVIGAARPGELKHVEVLRAAARRLGIEERVEFIPNASNDQKKDALSTSKVLFHPKRYEHFGMAIVEGMAAGCTPVVFDGGGPVEFVPPEWRTSSSEEYPPMIDRAIEAWDPQSASRISHGTQRFSRGNFQNQLQRIMAEEN